MISRPILLSVSLESVRWQRRHWLRSLVADTGIKPAALSAAAGYSHTIVHRMLAGGLHITDAAYTRLRTGCAILSLPIPPPLSTPL